MEICDTGVTRAGDGVARLGMSPDLSADEISAVASGGSSRAVGMMPGRAAPRYVPATEPAAITTTRFLFWRIVLKPASWLYRAIAINIIGKLIDVSFGLVLTKLVSHRSDLVVFPILSRSYFACPSSLWFPLNRYFGCLAGVTPVIFPILVRSYHLAWQGDPLAGVGSAWRSTIGSILRDRQPPFASPPPRPLVVLVPLLQFLHLWHHAGREPIFFRVCFGALAASNRRPCRRTLPLPIS